MKHEKEQREGQGLMDQARLIQAGLKKGALLQIKAYCRNEDCPFRTLQLEVKDDFGDKRLRVSRTGYRGLNCPLCAELLTLDWVAPAAVYAHNRDIEARGLVAAQMYRRDYGDDAGVADALLDERLPPTPTDWWEAEDR